MTKNYIMKCVQQQQQEQEQPQLKITINKEPIIVFKNIHLMKFHFR